jgi:hypothetical protein
MYHHTQISLSLSLFLLSKYTFKYYVHVYLGVFCFGYWVVGVPYVFLMLNPHHIYNL